MPEQQTTVPTYWARIFVGLAEGYDGPLHDLDEVIEACQKFVDRKGLCVTVTPTTYIYTKGREAGAIVGLINYPRFPKAAAEVRAQATELAWALKRRLNQYRVSVMFPSQTVMLGGDEEDGA